MFLTEYVVTYDNMLPPRILHNSPFDFPWKMLKREKTFHKVKRIESLTFYNSICCKKKLDIIIRLCAYSFLGENSFVFSKVIFVLLGLLIFHTKDIA